MYSLNERFEDRDSTAFYENNAERDAVFNQAVSGSKMKDFAAQAKAVVSDAETMPTDKVGMIAILLGASDVCADSLDAMASSEQFESNYRAGFDVLAASSATRDAYIHVSGIPAIYWLWEAKRNNDWCLLAWYFVPCQNLLDEPVNDCDSGNSHLDPNIIHPDDGENCVRQDL